MFFHLHKYSFESQTQKKHNHKICGYTEKIIGFGMFHFHIITGISSYDGHIHNFSGFTGIPIKTENGHSHKMQGLLKHTKAHEHKYYGYTSEEVSYLGTGCKAGCLKI